MACQTSRVTQLMRSGRRKSAVARSTAPSIAAPSGSQTVPGALTQQRIAVSRGVAAVEASIRIAPPRQVVGVSLSSPRSPCRGPAHGAALARALAE